MFCFTSLPNEIQEIVYDRLHINDRINLNRALPRSERIVKTINTNRDKDRKLRVMHTVFKKKKVQIQKLSMQIIDFLTENITDPTVTEIVKENNLQWINGKPDNHYQTVQQFVKKIANETERNNITPECFDAIANLLEKEIEIQFGLATETEIDRSKVNEYLNSIMTGIARYCTPTMFDNIMNCSTQFRTLLNRISDNYYVKSFLFTTLNHQNFTLFRYVISCQYMNEPFLQNSLIYIREPRIASIFVKTNGLATLEQTKLLIELCNLSQETVDDMLACAINSMNIDVIEYLLPK